MTRRELEEFACFGIAQTIDAGNTIANGEHGSHLVKLFGILNAFQLFEQHLGYFAWFNLI